MYHIKQDKRAQSSAKLISEALKSCIKEKSFENVTISDIQRVSGVSRSTFYRSFDRIDDVLALMCDEVFAEAFGSDYENIGEAVFRTWCRHSDITETIVRIGRGDILYASLHRCTRKLQAGLTDGTDEALSDYLVSIISSAMMGIMVTWAERGRSESEEELKSLILRSFELMRLAGII